MKSFYDIQQFLKRYGTIIYTGNRIGDLELMSEELKELSISQLITEVEYKNANLIIQEELKSMRVK